MTNGCPIFECSTGIPITDKYYRTQNEYNDIVSTHGDKYDDDITENVE